MSGRWFIYEGSLGSDALDSGAEYARENSATVPWAQNGFQFVLGLSRSIEL